jgi:hypothetical protein
VRGKQNKETGERIVSIEIDKAKNGCYTVSARITDTDMVIVEIGDSAQFMAIGLERQKAVVFLENVLDRLR